MNSRILILGFVICAVFRLSGISQIAAAPSPNPLEVRLMGPSLHFDKAPLTKALSELFFRSGNPFVRSGNDFVVFGVEIVLEHGEEPLVSADISDGVTLGQALNQVLAGNPDYTFEVVGAHLINVFPRWAPNDPEDILNLRISAMDLSDVVPGDVLSNPAKFIPELKTALTKGVRQGCLIGPGLSSVAPTVTVHVKSSTLRQVLNTVSQASIEAAQNNHGAAYGWVYLHEKFPSESAKEHTWRVYDFIWEPRIARN
jgi:hypothetical protein